MTTQDLSVSQLWDAHWRNPNNATIRNAIALRDPNGAKQLWPITKPCGPSENARVISDLQSEVDELNEELGDAAVDSARVAELETEVEGLETEVDKLKAELAGSISA